VCAGAFDSFPLSCAGRASGPRRAENEERRANSVLLAAVLGLKFNALRRDYRWHYELPDEVQTAKINKLPPRHPVIQQLKYFQRQYSRSFTHLASINYKSGMLAALSAMFTPSQRAGKGWKMAENQGIGGKKGS